MVRGKQTQQGHGESEETRRMILRVSHHLSMQYIYHAVTTRQLADACGLTQPALYHYCSDKQELYMAVVTGEIAQIKAAIERIMRRSDEVPELLKQVAIFLLGRTQYDLSLMLHDVRYEMAPGVRQQLGEQFRNGFILPISTIFERGINQGDLQRLEEGGLSPLSAAYLFMNMLSYFARASERNFAGLAEAPLSAASADALVHILLHGISRTDKA